MFFLCQEMQIKIVSLIMTSSSHHQPPFNTHPKVVINRAKFDVCKPSSFGGVKTHTHTLILP